MRLNRIPLHSLLAGLGFILVVNVNSRGQDIGPGSSPGRAAYRPANSWNDGPFQAVGHWNPYAPHPATSTGMIYGEADLPPYTNGPHGRFSAFSSERGTLNSYSEGFSPYSGFSNWYKRANNFQPTDKDIDRAKSLFFRSEAPRVMVIPTPTPAEPATVPQPKKAVSKNEKAQPVTTKPAGKLMVPGRTQEQFPAVAIPVYRPRRSAG